MMFDILTQNTILLVNDPKWNESLPRDSMEINEHFFAA